MLLIANDEGRSGIPKAFDYLINKNDGLRSIIEGIKVVEANTDIHTVGRGGWPNILGQMELDASVMDGDSLKVGSVGAIQGYHHPVEIAYEIMNRLDHVMLTGEGASRFAKEIGAENISNLTETAEEAWKKFLDEILTLEQKNQFPDVSLLSLKSKAVDPEKIFDTTVYMSKDFFNKISAATSTSGWAWKYPGRLGDSPIVGGGLYADSRYGACVCTHTGEMAIRACTSRSVVLYMKMGMSVEEAVKEAANDLKALKGGYLDELTIHAFDKDENYKVISYKGSVPVYYWIWKDGMKEPAKEQAEFVEQRGD